MLQKRRGLHCIIVFNINSLFVPYSHHRSRLIPNKTSRNDSRNCTPPISGLSPHLIPYLIPCLSAQAVDGLDISPIYEGEYKRENRVPPFHFAW